jgi:hypothetical protein
MPSTIPWCTSFWNGSGWLTRIQKPQVVPTRPRPLRHGVGLARVPAAVLLEEAPIERLRQRALHVPGLVVVELGQAQRQLRVRDSDRLVVVDFERVPASGIPGGLDREVDRDRLTPVTLAGEHPVAQLEIDPASPDFPRFQIADDVRLHVRGALAVVGAGANGDAVFGEGLIERLVLRAVGADDLDDRQAERARKLEIALVVSGHGHDRAGAVGAEHVVGGVDRDRAAGQRIFGIRAREHARLAAVQGRTLEVALAGGFFAVTSDLRLMLGCSQARCQPVIGCDHHIRRAVQRVRARRKYRQRLIATDDRKVDFGALATTDPVALFFASFRPIQRLQLRRQPLGVVGDAELPLAQRHAHDRMIAALASPVDHFLVGQHRAERRAPVDRHLRLERQAALEQLQEDPLRPAHVARIGGVDLARPVVGKTQGFQLSPEDRDVFGGGDARVLPGRDRVLLGG